MIVYSDSIIDVGEENLQGFFVGWAKVPLPNLHLKALQNSDHVVIVRDLNTGAVIGFVTAISDNVLAAYIPLLEVLLHYQNQGIGSELMARMLAKLKGLYMVDLICDEEVQKYYEGFGMKKATEMMSRDSIRDTDIP